MVFKDRVDAGKKLAERLEKYKGPDTIVFGIPRGGVVLAYEVAVALNAPLDVIIPRKIGAPGQPELAIGAIGNDITVLEESTIRYLGVSQEYIQREIERQKQEIARRWKLYRDDKPFPDIKGKTVLLVDDGVATGNTTLAAIRALREREPGKLVLAVPVGPPETIERIRPEVDDLVVLETPEMFMAVGYWYEQFEQTSDEEVIALLHRADNRS